MSPPSAPQAVSTYDLVVIGAGPAGQAAAVEAAALGRRVAIVERSPELGGAAVRSGVLPSATLRAAVMEATGAGPAGVRRSYRGDREVVLDDLLWRMDGVLHRARQAVRDRLRRGRVDVVTGQAAFIDARTVGVNGPGGRMMLRADRFLIACGRRPGRLPGIDVNGRTVVDVDRILEVRGVPRSLTVVGAGRMGLEYASIFAALGARVTVAERRAGILSAADEQIADALQYHLRGIGVSFHLGRAVTRVVPGPEGATWVCADGTASSSDVVLVTVGRVGATDRLGLGSVGVTTDARGRVPVDDQYRTTCPTVFAAGDVARGSATRTSAQEQGRVASRIACGAHLQEPRPPTPTSILTIPEISFVGFRERDLADTGTPYERGFAHYRDLVRGDIAGDRVGMLKLLVHRRTRRVLGVHIFGTAAAELVHIGQTVMAADLPVDHLIEAPYAEPTFADAYRMAAADAVRRMLGGLPSRGVGVRPGDAGGRVAEVRNG